MGICIKNKVLVSEIDPVVLTMAVPKEVHLFTFLINFILRLE